MNGGSAASRGTYHSGMQEPGVCATNSAGDLGDGEIVELGMTMSGLNG